MCCSDFTFVCPTEILAFNDALPAFQARYQPTAAAHWASCAQALPAECVACQMHKLADGLLSGRYPHPRPAGNGGAAQDAGVRVEAVHDRGILERVLALRKGPLGLGRAGGLDDGLDLVRVDDPSHVGVGDLGGGKADIERRIRMQWYW